MLVEKTDRIDLTDENCRASLIEQCRLKSGEVWHDPKGLHIVACGDATDSRFVESLFEDQRATLAVHDPPYNLVAFAMRSADEYVEWCRKWVDVTTAILGDNASMYIWLGADQKKHFQPLPQFMLMMTETDFASRSFITMRNQRGYGTQKNWMAVRQELLCYTLGNPEFNVQYTDIPKILRGYYKEVQGQRSENLERSRSDTIRPGNVWVDIQQVFYRMHENVPGCYAQKPLKAIERIILACTSPNEIVTDFFAHSGTTLIACEQNKRRCITFDIDPIFAELTIRRLERYREIGVAGWQSAQPFRHEMTTAIAGQ